MSDLVERLRRYKRDRSGYAEYCHQAADEIERNRAAIAELQDDMVAVERVSEYRLEAIAELVELLKYAHEAVSWSTEFQIGRPDYEHASARLHQAIAKYDNTNGPDFFDGCSLEGFVGGCERMGCHQDLTTKETK